MFEINPLHFEGYFLIIFYVRRRGPRTSHPCAVRRPRVRAVTTTLSVWSHHYLVRAESPPCPCGVTTTLSVWSHHYLVRVESPLPCPCGVTTTLSVRSHHLVRVESLPCPCGVTTTLSVRSHYLVRVESPPPCPCAVTTTEGVGITLRSEK